MAGIYIHIPFCKQRCTYCDFYTRVAPLQIENTVKAIVREIEIRCDYLQNETISTIYFGGGTPSLLKPHHFEVIFEQLNKYYSIDSKAEITFEANPDDLDNQFFESISHIPFNRISMGIQTFDDIQLKKINRRHTGIDAINAYQNARKAGFNNISVDLIYGLPDQHLQNWEIQLKKAIEIHPEHISVYGLTYEPGTPLHKQRELGKVINATDEIMIEMHLKALELLQKAGYEAYEVSNYALKGFRSQHNSAYWKGQKYLGIGPSAHSFDGNSRQWNLSSLKDYNHAIENNLTFFEREELSIQDKYNEYIMVGLRTAEGVNIEFISQQFDIDYANYFIDKSASYINSHKMLQQENQFSLTTSGLLISNTIIEDLIRIS